jgi:N,N'-diacetylchitobiose phosphorylase
MTRMRDSFLGPYRTETNPLAVEQARCNSTELGGNHCGALQKKIERRARRGIPSGLHAGRGTKEKRTGDKRKYSVLNNVDKEFAALKSYWQKKLSAFQCKTPHQGLDTMVNIWTLYQAETCVVWSRFASFVEVGGRTGLGFRDTSQDVMSVVHTNPAKCRQRIVELLKAQVSQGYGLHLFDPDWFDPEKQKAPTFKSPTYRSCAQHQEHDSRHRARLLRRCAVDRRHHVRICQRDRRQWRSSIKCCPSPTRAKRPSTSTSSALWIFPPNKWAKTASARD